MNKKVLNISLVISFILFLASAYMALPYAKSVMQSKKRLKGPVKAEKREDGWHLMVGGKPFFVKGVCYRYTPIGKGAGYDFFASPEKPHLIDGALMKKMGANAVRLYEPGYNPEQTKTVIRDFFEKYGIKTALGHFLGFWDWPPADYSDPAFRENMKKEIIDMVKTYKDEPGILFWVIGNENNYSFDRGLRDWTTPEIDLFRSPQGRREAKAEIYYKFVNEITKSIKEIDLNHPVVMGNGELVTIYVAKEFSPDVDILGGIVYQGKTFGTYFQRLDRNFGKPNVFMEFGADRYDAFKKEEAEDWQAFFLKMQWLEICENKAGDKGDGNSLGGFVFEWCDEWWKHNAGYKPGRKIHDTNGNWDNTAYYFDAKARSNMNEEWWGIVGLDHKRKTAGGIEKRIPKKAYYVLKSLWTEEGGKDAFIYLIAAAIFLVLGIVIAMVRIKIKG